MPAIGTISGLCADYSKSTLNGRPYDKIYERILKGKDFRFNEMMKRGGIPCELGHPTDFDPNGVPRTEPDPTKVAVILTEIKQGGPKQLVASGKIMDTPNGRIFKALSEYYNFGLSSRGSYEVDDEDPQSIVEGPDGWNQDSYVFKGYDLVLLPANPASSLSVTESLSSRSHKIVKVARESIDVSLLAKASQVSEEDVNMALDDLFKIDKDAEKGEELTVQEMKEELGNPTAVTDKVESGEIPEGSTADLNSEVLRLMTEEEDAIKSYQGSIDLLTGKVDDSVIQVLEHIKAEEEEHLEELTKVKNGEAVELDKHKSDETSITDGEDVDKIKADLEKALAEIGELKEGREKDEAEKSNRDAEVEKLTLDNQDLRTELDERVKEAEELTEKFEALKEISSQLVKSYKEVKADLGKKDEDKEKSDEEHKLKLEEAEKKEKEATESFNRERAISAGLRAELRAAKESLISNNALALGVSEAALRSRLGKTFKVKDIRPAAESLASQAVNYRMPSFSVAPKRSSATESFSAGDEIERELLDQIKNN